jgi:hypothetical protein
MEDVSEDELLEKMEALGFGPSFLHQMRVGDPESGRGFGVLTDWRKLKAPYEVNWVGSIYNGAGEETHRFVVRR